MRPVAAPFAVLVVAITLFPAAARAGIPAPVMPRGGLHPGEVVELSWPALPPDVRELEIQLSLDDGRSWPLRVSAELEGRERAFRWRVPNLAASRARLRLRGGDEMREYEGAPTAAFAILPDPRLPRARFAFHEAAWWDGLPGTAGPSPVATFAPGDGSPRERSGIAAPPRQEGPADAAASSRVAVTATAPRTSTSRRASSTRPRRTFPLRS
jgi:hypothetical protein